MKVAFFDAKPYDIIGFDRCIEGTDISIKYFETHLNEDTVSLAAGFDGVSTMAAWMGAAAFSFQLYFDFCGYSDMAIGLGRVFGLDSTLGKLMLVGVPVLAGVVVYVVCVIKLKAITREDCLLLPKGAKIAKLLKL